MRRSGMLLGWLLFALMACRHASSGGTSNTNAASNQKSSSQSSKASGEGSSQQTGGASGSPSSSKSDAGTGTRADAATAPAGKAGAGGSNAGGKDAGEQPSQDAGVAHMPDAGGAAGHTGTPDAAVLPDGQVGMLGMGSCCSEHDTPGCSNADLQVCVCEKVSSCCTTAWDHACVLIVKEKYCQPGVRDCVCGDGAGQQGQHSCCDVDWSDTFCNSVAMNKCSAVPGCL